MDNLEDSKEKKNVTIKSPEKFFSILNSLNEPMHIIDRNYKIQFLNIAMTQWLIKLEIDVDIIGESLFKMFDFLEYDEIYKEYDNVFNTGETLITNEVINLNTHRIFTEVQKIPVKSNEKVEQIVTIIRDITEQKLAEEKLKESEEKFRTIAEQSFMGIFIIQDGILKYYNKEAIRINNYSREEIQNWKPFEFLKLIHPDDREFVMEQVLKKQAGDPDVQTHHQYRVLKKNGEAYWVDNFSKSINYEGKPADFVMTIDISDKITSEDKIKESEENFRTIAEQAFVGTLIVQNDKVEYVNDALLKIFEFTKNDVENWTINDLIKLIYPEDLENLREHRKRIKAGESDMNSLYSYRVFTKYGKLKWIDQFLKQIIYRGKPAELISILDITEKKKAEQELIKLNNLKSEILRRTSHELKTPLVSIKGFSDLLLTVHREKLNDYVLATIHEIKLGCERLENLIQDILKSSELESGTVELKKKEEDLSFLIKLCIKELGGLIRLRDHEIILEIHDKLISWFEPDQIHLVISNLLSNAIKYTPPGGKIIIRSAKTQDYIIISIEDNGIGISNDEKKRLFSQFGKIERYGQGLDIIAEGSGLGLFITKKIIELHGGKIRVKSKGRNKGSTFSFTIPRIFKNKKPD
ncbi:MAG: PAS domain S-box protein [Promethearchaeota archaeon]